MQRIMHHFYYTCRPGRYEGIGMTTVSPSQVCVGRQPIYDRAREIVAYELLYRRNGSAATAEFEDGDAATARVLVNVFTEIGLEERFGSKPLFLNCTRYFLENEPVLPPKRCVLEILETIVVDPSLVKAAVRLRKHGYKIALDDFVYNPEWDPLLKIADYVKIDVRQHTPDQLTRAVKQLPGFSGVLLAEKIETQQELDLCRQLGFKLFQGYYLRKPETLVGRAAPNNLIALINLSQQLMDRDVNAAEIAESIHGDVTLTYRLLRLVNSAMAGSRTPVRSIRQAVAIAGTDLLARWVALLGLLRIENSPGGYIEIALQRARACEILSQEERIGRPDQAYIVGLLSLLDAMLGSPWETLLPSLPLDAEITDALASHKGGLGRLLTAVESFETFTTSGTELPSEESSLPSLPKAFWDGVAYAQELTRSLKQFAGSHSES
jgi:EAL and modified HD-GYP domain-containing signal transduction protein